MGSFRLSRKNPHLHGYFNFTEIVAETVEQSLHYSCRTPIMCLGISLPQDRYSYSRHSRGFRIKTSISPLKLSSLDKCQSVYIIKYFAQTCVFNKQSLFSLYCDCTKAALFIPKLQSNFAEFLSYYYLKRLSIFY